MITIQNNIVKQKCGICGHESHMQTGFRMAYPLAPDIRNEKAFEIYNFMDGKTFEPDYLLIANDKKTGNISYQIL